MKVTMMLADAAQAVGGKLYILGGGWSVTGPVPTAYSLALKIEVPWDETNKRHTLVLRLLDEDGRPVRVPAPSGEEVPLEIPADFEVGRPAGTMTGTPIDMPVVVNIGPMPLQPGRRFVWRLFIDGRSDPDWEASFATRPPAAAPKTPGRGGSPAQPA
jgi:hypothetical protein